MNSRTVIQPPQYTTKSLTFFLKQIKELKRFPWQHCVLYPSPFDICESDVVNVNDVESNDDDYDEAVNYMHTRLGNGRISRAHSHQISSLSSSTSSKDKEISEKL